MMSRRLLTTSGEMTSATSRTMMMFQCRNSAIVSNASLVRTTGSCRIGVNRFLRIHPSSNNNNSSLRSFHSTNKTCNSTTTTTTATTATANAKKPTFVAWYEHQLETRPVQTKMVTGGLLWGLGDFVAQIVPVVTALLLSSSNNDSTDSTKKNDSTSSSLFQYDMMRTFRAALFGFAFHAPLSHVHYNFLEYITLRWKVTGYYIPVFKATMEQFVYWSWFSNSLYHGVMEVLSTATVNPTAIYNRINDVLWETQKAQWVFWIPIQLINFQYTPVRHQLNVVLVTSVVWTALLSAWYPPTPTTTTTSSVTAETVETETVEVTTVIETPTAIVATDAVTEPTTK